MRIGAFEIHEPVPQLRNPHVFTMIRPWVDVGSVVSITLDRLESHFGAKELGRLARPGNYFDFTRYRPTISLVEGHREIIVPNSVINYVQTEDGTDLIFCRLHEPHASAEEYADSVLDVLKYLAISRHARLGAMYDAVPHTKPILVTGDTGGVATKGDAGNLIRRQSKYQGPTSILNLISDGVAKLDPAIEIMSFMVHLPQYIQIEQDYAGAARLLEVLSSIYDLPTDLADKEQGDRQYRELDKAVGRNPELQSLIEWMESRYEAQVSGGEEGASESPTLSSEVEHFLREMNQRFGEPGQSG